MFKVITVIALLINSAVSAAPIGKLFSVSTMIIGNQDGSELALEADQYVFLSSYNISEQKFNDVYIDFKLKSPESTSLSHYQIELSESKHLCESSNIDISVYLDEEEILQGDKSKRFGFQNISDGIRLSDHRFTLSSPIITQVDHPQNCDGIIGIKVELVL